MITQHQETIHVRNVIQSLHLAIYVQIILSVFNAKQIIILIQMLVRNNVRNAKILAKHVQGHPLIVPLAIR